MMIFTRLLNSGANVALIGRDWDSLSSIGAEFPKQALAIKCDLTRDEQQYDMCNAVITLWKSIDILINAAGESRVIVTENLSSSRCVL